jgi:DNA-binding protein YbaB
MHILIGSKVMTQMQKKTQKRKNKSKKRKEHYTNNNFFTKLKKNGKGNICVLTFEPIKLKNCYELQFCER